MKRLLLALTLLTATACGPIHPPPPNPIPPPPITAPATVTAGLVAWPPLPLDERDHYQQWRSLMRSPVSSASDVDTVLATYDSTWPVLLLVETENDPLVQIIASRGSHPNVSVELGNELSFTQDPHEINAWYKRAIPTLLAAGYTVDQIVTGGIPNLEADSLQWFATSVEGLPAGIHYGWHAYNNWQAHLNAFAALLNGHPCDMTESGGYVGDEAAVRDRVAQEGALITSVCGTYVYYQNHSGTTPNTDFGIHAPDGHYRLVEDAIWHLDSRSITTTHVLTATVRNAAGEGVVGLTAAFTPDYGTSACEVDDANSRFRCVSTVPKDTGGGWLDLTAPTYLPLLEREPLDLDFNLTLQSAHVDPSQIPLTTLAAIRGSMWTARLNLPYGPRPNQDSNILALAFYDSYDAPTKARMLQSYRAHGYTHGVTGPSTNNDCYHGLWPCRQGVPSQAEWDAYLDSMQEWWDAGITPIYFAHPDGLSDPNQMAALDALYRQPRAQQLLRIVVYTGWEPSAYDWPNALWVRWLQRGAQVFPNALRLVHTVSDIDALVGGPDDPMVQIAQTQGWGPAWKAVVPYIHGWLVQVGGYAVSDNPIPTPDFISEFQKLFDSSNDSLTSRFRRGTHGWPTTSAFGASALRVYAAEFAAYGDFWRNFPEAEAIHLGNIAMCAGADGVLDGLSVSVPMTDQERAVVCN